MGLHCESDEECGAGSCLTSNAESLLGGGAGANVCVLDCTSDANLCDGYERELVCVQTLGGSTQETKDDRAYCFESCEIGGDLRGKCSGRTQLACDDSFEGSGDVDAAFCRPLCSEDSDCEEGTCDLGRGVCSASPREGQELGAECGSGLPACAGLCLEEAGLRYCSQRCVLGQEGQCGGSGFCGVYGAANSSDGDLGYCQQVCDCNEDCGHPEAVCAPDAFSAEVTGRAGVCVSELFAENTGMSCPVSPSPDAGGAPVDGGAGSDAGVDAGK